MAFGFPLVGAFLAVLGCTVALALGPVVWQLLLGGFSLTVFSLGWAAFTPCGFCTPFFTLSCLGRFFLVLLAFGGAFSLAAPGLACTIFPSPVFLGFPLAWPWLGRSFLALLGLLGPCPVASPGFLEAVLGRVFLDLTLLLGLGTS